MSEVDFVVIGAGTAGCVLADRLSADGRSEVLVLEAGGLDTSPAIHDPRRWGELLGSSNDWGYVTQPQAFAANRAIGWPRGKVVGGGSSINFLVHMRGSSADYDQWSALGCKGWDYQSVLPAFRSMENFCDGDAAFRGSGGPLSVQLPSRVSPLSEAALEAALETGHKFNPDFNGQSISGVGWNQLAMKNGRRHSAAQAFLHPALTRNNLTLRTTATVRQLTLQRERVVSVEFEVEGKVESVSVRGEVLLAAGTIESPKLLMLSGIGHADELRQQGIPVQIDLPGVGKNLHDHPGIGITFSSRQTIPASLNQSSELGLFASVDPGADFPQCQFGVLTVPYVPPSFHAPPNGFTLYPSWCKPRSRGSIKLKSANPRHAPFIDPAYLSAEEDVRGLAAVIELSRELAHAPGLREWTDVEVVPGPKVQTQSDLAGYIRSAVDTWFHPVGTCRMGVGANAVVAPDLKVYGLGNLRVVDASIMPEVPTGNTNAATMMIAWRAAQMILDERSA